MMGIYEFKNIYIIKIDEILSKYKYINQTFYNYFCNLEMGDPNLTKYLLDNYIKYRQNLCDCRVDLLNLDCFRKSWWSYDKDYYWEKRISNTIKLLEEIVNKMKNISYLKNKILKITGIIN